MRSLREKAHRPRGREVLSGDAEKTLYVIFVMSVGTLQYWPA